MLTTKEQATDRLTESIDLPYYDSLESQMRYAFGEPWGVGSRRGGSNASLPYIEPVRLHTRKVGRSMKILANTLVELSSIMDQEPEPTWTQLHKYASEARRQVWIERFKRFGWKSEFEKAYLDMANLGLGILEVGVRTDRETGLQYATFRHSPLVQTIKDAHEPDPAKWRYVAFAKYLAPEDAVKLYGKKNKAKIDGAVVEIDGDVCRKVVRVIDYYDIGYGNGDPTHIVFLGDVGGEILIGPEPNEDGVLPFVYGENVLLPGFKHHVGKILLQMAEQEARNVLEKAIQNTVRDSGLDIVNTEKVDKEEYQRARRNGDTSVFAKAGNIADQEPPINRIPPREVAATTFQYMQDLDRQLNAMSGTTDLEKGSQLNADRTLGEIQLVDQRSRQARGRMIRQTMHLYVRAVKMWERFARKYDRLPCNVSVLGAQMVFNDPSEPAGSFEMLFEDQSEIVISPQSLTQQDEQMKMQLRINQLALMRGDPMFDQRKVAEEIVKAMGEDPAEFLAQQSSAQPMPGAIQGAPAQIPIQQGTP